MLETLWGLYVLCRCIWCGTATHVPVCMYVAFTSLVSTLSSTMMYWYHVLSYCTLCTGGSWISSGDSLQWCGPNEKWSMFRMISYYKPEACITIHVCTNMYIHASINTICVCSKGTLLNSLFFPSCAISVCRLSNSTSPWYGCSSTPMW